jgi:hypothetical protein
VDWKDAHEKNEKLFLMHHSARYRLFIPRDMYYCDERMRENAEETKGLGNGNKKDYRDVLGSI